MTVPPRILGREVLAVEDLTRPWATAVRTTRATLQDGRVVVHQAGLPTPSGRAGIARRIRLGAALRAAAPTLGVPAVLDGDPAADPPFLVMAFVPGRTGEALLGTDADAVVLGRVAGEAARTIAAVAARIPGISSRGPWSDPGRLRVAAERWLGSATAPSRGLVVPGLALEVVPAMARILAHIPDLFAGSDGERQDAVLAHGDLVPVNLVVDGERLAAILDVERLRVAPLAFDVAWFRLLVRHHHPEAWAHAGPALLDAARLGGGRDVTSTLDDIAILATLEAAASFPRRSSRRAAWLARAGELVRHELPGP